MRESPAVPLIRPRPLPRRLPRAAGPAPSSPVGFFLFIVLNASLFIRPAEVLSSLASWEIYQYLILLTLAASFPAVLGQLQARSLQRRPITVFVLGIFLAVVLSQLSHANFADALDGGEALLKIVLYYLLFVGLVTTPARLRSFLWWMGVFSAVCTALALLNYFHVISLPRVAAAKDGVVDHKTGTEVILERLAGTGIFQDPNDFCVLMVVSILLTFYWLTDRASGMQRILWLGPLGLFLTGLALTHSRGGMLALLVGLMAFFHCRYGLRRAATLMGFLLPVLLLAFAGRQTDFSTSSGTGQSRIQLWRDGVVLFRQSPVFGIGYGNYRREAGLVAHNSYLHAFTELGLFGGVCFLGSFAFALLTLLRLGRPPTRILDPELRRLYPYLFGLLGGYATGMVSLTLVYILPTYTMLGTATAYLDMTRTEPPMPPVSCDSRLLGRMTGISLLFMAGMYVFVRLFAS